MADVNISKYRASVVRDGSKPASPGFVVSEGQDPVNPPGTNNFVPYTGATANVELGEFGVEAGFVTLDTTPTNIPTDQGAIYWDDTRSTAALIMNGTLQHIGQDVFFYVKNSSGSSIPKGTAVRFAGTNGASGHILIEPFLANGTYPSSYFMGVTSETIANGAFGQVMHFGELTGINTSGFTAGALLYASTTVAGGFQTTAPVAPNNIVLIAAAINSTNNGAIIVRPQIGSNINNDEGVKITSPTTGDLLQLQAGGLWENKTLAQVIGSAYVPSTRTITINGTAFDLSANRSWIVGDVRTDGSYSNPSWITALAWSKITGTPTTLSGYGITDAVPSSRTITINGVTQDLSANRTFNVGTVTSVGLSSATSGVTIGSTPVTSSGTITLAIATATATQNGLLSSTDWSTFNNKQNALTNPVTGTGTTNYLAKFTGSTTIGNSQIFDNGTNVGIGTATPAQLLTVRGSATNLISLHYNNDGGGVGYGIYNAAGTELWSIGGGRFIQQDELAISRQGVAALYINSSRNVLIGTTTDNGARLQVSGTARISGSGSTNLVVERTGSNGAFMQLLDGSGNSVFLGANNGDFQLQTPSGGFSNKLVVTNGGNVGIGTGSPVERLHVETSSEYQITWARTGAGKRWAIGTDTAGFYFNNRTDSILPLYITNGGNVLIGTTTDIGATLNVNGTIRTSAPSGGTAVNWRLGTARAGTITPNATVRVEIGGVLVDLDARYV